MLNQREILSASLCIVLVLSAVLTPVAVARTTNGGQSSTAAVTSTPGVHLPDATINSSTDSAIEVSYSLPESATPENWNISIGGPNYRAKTGGPKFNGSITSQNGTLNFTVPADTIRGGNHTLTARLEKTESGETSTEAVTTNNLTVTTPVTIQDTDIEDGPFYTNEQINATATLTNPTDASESFTLATYTKSGRSKSAKTVSVAANSTINATVNESFRYSGTYSLAVNDAPNESVVVDPSLQIASLNLSTTDTYLNENVTANVTVENVGPEQDDRYFYGTLFSEIDSQTAVLDPGNETTLQLTVPASRTGTADFHVNDNSIGQVEVTNPVNASTVSFESDSVSVGTPVNTTVEVVNTADVNGTFPIGLTTQGGFTAWGNTTVSLNASESKDVTFETTFPTAGTHEVQVQNNTVTSPVVRNPIGVESYNLSTNEAYVGENVTVNATVVNTGNSSGSFPVSITRWGRVVASTNVALDPDNSTTVQFNASFDSSVGSRSRVTLNNASINDLQVQPRIQTENIEIQDGVAPGETIWVNATYTNPTDEPATTWVNTEVNQSNYTEISLSSGQTVTVNRSGNFSESGAHRVWANTESVRVYVLNDTEGTANLTLEDDNVPSRAVVGDTVFVPMRVTNDGDAAGVQTYDVKVDGAEHTTMRAGVEPGQSEFVWFRTSFDSAGQHTVTVNGKTYDLTVIDPIVTDTTVTYVNGTETVEAPEIEAQYNAYGGGISAMLKTPSQRYDLGRIGADETTRFRVNVTLQDYEPRVLLNTGNETTWTTENVSANKTKVSILMRPSQLNFKQNANSIENWETQNDTADFTIDAGAWMVIGNGNNTRYDVEPEVLDGLTVSTDAQKFRQPRYIPETNDSEPRIEVAVAGPHFTVDGTVNQGHYTAKLPDNLLDAWNVSDPSELTVDYSADSDDTQYTIEEVDDGLQVTVQLHYSSGTVSIAKATSDSTDDTSDSTDDTSDSTDDTSDSIDDASDPTDDTSDSTDDTSDSTDDTSAPTDSTTNSTDGTTNSTDNTTEETMTNQTTVTTTTEDTTTTESTDTSTTASTDDETSAKAPGFGITVAAIALLGATLLARRN